MCRGACNLGTSTIECIKSGGHDLDVVPTTPCMLRRALRPVSSRGVLVPTGPAANKVPAPPRRPHRPRRRRRSRPLTDWLAAAPDLHPPRLGVGGVDIPNVVLQLLRPLEQEAREVLLRVRGGVKLERFWSGLGVGLGFWSGLGVGLGLGLGLG